MIEKYLLERKQILENAIRKNKEIHEHNQIAIVELNNQIKELKNDVDEATQIFSVKAREDNGFKKQEIEDIEKRIATYVSENMGCKDTIKCIEKELAEVNRCIEQLEKDNVSRETLKQTTDAKHQLLSLDIKEKIRDKIILCKNIADVDGQRVQIELDNILKILD